MVKKGAPELYNKEFFKLYYPKKGPIAEEIKKREERALNLLNLFPKAKLLDIGCGDGNLVYKAARKHVRCVGIDYSIDAIRLAQDNLKIREESHYDIKFLVMDASSLSFSKGSFDRVVSIDLIEHVEKKQIPKVFSEIERVLNKGGVAVIRTAPNEFFERPFQILAKLLLQRKNLETEKYHISLQNYFSLKNNLRSIRNKKIMIRNDGKMHFSAKLEGMNGIPGWIKTIAKTLDKFLDSKIMTYLAEKTPLGIFLGRDFWIIIEK